MTLLAALVIACEATLPLDPTPTPVAPAPPAAPGSPAAPATAPPGTPLPNGATPGRIVGSPPALTPGGAEGEWLYLAHFPAEGAIEVAGVAAHGDGYVAVGSEPFPGEGFAGRRNGIVWTSSDGVGWTRAQPEVLANVTLSSVVSLGGEVLAFGRYSVCSELSEDCVDAPEAGIGLWRSADAADWQRLALPDSLRTGILDGVATDGVQIVAYGSTGDDLVGALWLSASGEQWQELRDVGVVDPISTLGAGDGRLVAFGTRYLPDEDEIETLAGYSEGGAFGQATLPAGQRGVIHDVAWSERGFVAVGAQFEATGDRLAAAALVSGDGVDWTGAATADLPAEAGFEHVLVLPRGYLAIGSVPTDEFGRELAHSWFSADGRSWEDYAALSGGSFSQLSSSVLGSQGALVFATDFDESEELAPPDIESGTIHAWFAPLEGLP